MILDIAIIAVTLVLGALLFWPRLARRTLWQATVTPLASIIGSGFLVLGPTLNATYGGWAPLVMAALCAVAWLLGGAVRFNISRLAAAPKRTPLEHRLDTLAAWALAFAYVISVTYYLNLFGSFAVSLTPFRASAVAHAVTSGVLLAILAVGWRYGFKALEGLEQLSVTIKLAIIGGLLVGLVAYTWSAAGAGELAFNPPAETGWHAVAIAFGLIVTVQGFETSRYLGETYDAPTRIRSMRLAQLLATAIYMIYILLVAYSFEIEEAGLSETAIVDMMGVVATVLPFLLVLAALSAQFSAAVADTSGSGGLVAEQTAHKVPERWAYLALAGIGLVLTWSVGVFAIIAYASRAFALYYALQCAIAARGAWAAGRSILAAGYAALTLLAAAIAILGIPVEG